MDTRIAQRVDLATLGTTMQIVTRLEEAPMSTTIREHPPVDEIIAAASVLRPLFLENDGIHHDHVSASLRLLTRDSSPAAKEVVRRIREVWRSIPKSSSWAFFAGSENPDYQMPQMWDREIAGHWLYGDIVHADEKRQHQIRLVPEDDRIMAALLWVKDGILLTRATQQAVIDLENAGELK